jgi:hypothetical protein
MVHFSDMLGIQQGIFRLAGSQSDLNDIVDKLDDGTVFLSWNFLSECI